MSSLGSSQETPGAGGVTATSPTLLARVRARDAAAWDRLVELYSPFVFHYCRSARLPAQDAADVFQEVFQAAFTKIASFEKRAPGDSFRGWLRVITRNKVHDHFRRRRREPVGVGGTEIQMRLAEVGARDRSPEEEPPDEGAERPELRLFRDALEGIRDHFHPRTWQAFLGTVVDGRPPKDVGEELGMSAGAVRVAKSRVLQRLRAELADLP